MHNYIGLRFSLHKHTRSFTSKTKIINDINVNFAPNFPIIRLFVKYKIVNKTIFAAISLSD